MISLIGIKPDTFIPSAQREKGSDLAIPLPQDPETFVDEVREMIRENALEVLREKRYVVPEGVAGEHYAEHRGVYDTK